MLPSQQTPGPDHAAPRKYSLRWFQYVEPAVLRALAAALVALAGALGITLNVDLPGIAEALIGVLAVVVPIVQGVSTRAAVVSPQRADLIAAGRANTGLTDGPS